MRGPRRWRQLRAFLTGYFWLPCPNCGRMFAGFEDGGGILWEGSQVTPGTGWICCPRCPDTRFAAPPEEAPE